MVVCIEDDFSLEKIIESGQCFRPKALSGGEYLFVTGNHALKMRRASETKYDVSCSEKEWDGVWKKYFDLDRSYGEIRRKHSGVNAYVDAAAEYGKGIRILRQDKWEMLVSYIVSQRKSIPAIRRTVEYFADKFGTPIPGSNLSINAFPTAEQLSTATENDLKEGGLGYRLPFVAGAVRRMLEDPHILQSLCNDDDDVLVEKLKTFHGVGKKVANCVALFAYGRTSLAPVDVWIQKAIDEHFEGENIFSRYGDSAGIMQQYVFFYQRASKGVK